MYHDFAGREIEDLEMDNMRHDAREDVWMSKSEAEKITRATLQQIHGYVDEAEVQRILAQAGEVQA